MAGFGTVDHSSAVRQVRRIVENYQKLLKSQSQKNTKAVKDREAFLDDMKKCLDIGETGLRESLRTDRVRVNLNIATEDVSFYDDQFGPRRQAMSHKVDTEFARRKAANLKRKASSTPQPGPSSAKSPSFVNYTEDDEEDDEQTEQVGPKGDNDEDYVATSRREKRSEFITVQMPRNIFMSPELISALDRCKTSDYSAMRMFSKVFKQFYTVGGEKLNLNELDISRSGIRNNRIEQRNIIASQEKEKFKLNMPPRLSYGWDGKMLQDLENSKHEMQSQVVNGAPGYTEGKILDVIELTDEDGNPTSTGLAQAEANIITIMEWGVADKIVAFNFDTTASNTGIWSGSAIRLNQFLNRPVLYLACRHHVFELLAKNTFNKIVGYDPSPEVSMFKRMKEVFPHINTSGPFQTFDDVENKEELIELFTNILTKRNGDGELFIRKDYRELCMLALVMLGGDLPGGEVIRFVAPGAIHKARFLAFCLCGFKILAWSHLPEVREKCFSKKVKGKRLVFEEDALKNLWRWGNFAVKFYVPQFLLASLGRDAPSNDLTLYQNLLQYREVDQEIADIALDTMSRHLWYLAEHVVLFALFSDNVKEDEKKKMVAKLLSLPKDSVPSLGHPDFPVVTEDTQLWDLVTSKSWQFFDILRSDPVWLTQDVSEWDSDPDYCDLKAFVSTVKVSAKTFLI